MAEFTLNGRTKVKTLKANFKENFGATLRIYIGRSQVNDDMTLTEAGLKTEGIFECRSSLTCGRFIERMQEEFGLKVKIYTCDEWVAALDGLTLESAGKVKKNAVKADMERMIAYQRSENENDSDIECAHVMDIKKSAESNGCIINIFSNNSVTVLRDDKKCENTKAALREIAQLVDFNFETTWTTQQLGSKLVDFLNTNNSKTSQKNHIRVEIEITEHDYVAYDSNDEPMGESFAFNSDEGPNSIHIYVDGKEIEYDEDEFEDGSEYSAYQSFDMEKKWGNDEIVKFGYYDNIVTKAWEFEVENFNIEKLNFYYNCFDACFAPASHNWEEHIIELCYDGNKVELHSCGCSDGGFEQLWCMYDEFDDEDNEECWDNEESEDIESRLKDKYDKVFNDGDIFTVKLDGRWGFVGTNGEELITPQFTALSDEFVNGAIITWGENGLMGFVNIQGEEIVKPKYGPVMDFQESMAAVCLDGKWGFIDKSGTEIIPLIYDKVEGFENGKAKVTLNGEEFEIDTNGNRVAEEENPTQLLSNIFATLAWVIADMDDEITQEELEAMLGIASGFEEFDVDIVRQRLMLEKMGLRDYDSHSALAKQVPEEYRMMMLQALTMVAVSDFKIKEGELDVISGLSKIWDLDIDTANDIVNKIVSGFAAANPDREVECE